MRPGLRSFQPVRRGQVLATSGAEPVRAPSSGRLLLPLYQSSGDDGFFLGRPVAAGWLHLSQWARRVGAERVLRFLPGFRVEEDDRPLLQVHPRLFRLLPARFFFLLGYRPDGGRGGWVAMRRDREPGERVRSRRTDGTAPFRSGERRSTGVVIVRGGSEGVRSQGSGGRDDGGIGG